LEVECQRLAIELTKSDQEVSLLAARVEVAGGKLEQEGDTRVNRTQVLGGVEVEMLVVVVVVVVELEMLVV